MEKQSLKVVRIKKSPDWPDETWFHLFKDDDLINIVRIDDMIADDFGRCLIPTSTADELPPEGVDILWWYPGRRWEAGRYWSNEAFPPGYFDSYECAWYLSDGPTWWMHLPPSPEEMNNEKG